MRDFDLVDKVRRRDDIEEQGAASSEDEVDEGRVFGTNGQRKDLPPAQGHGKSRESGGPADGPQAGRLDVSRDVRDVRGCLRAQNRNAFGSAC